MTNPTSPADEPLDERIVAIIREYDAMRGEMHNHRIPCPVCVAAEREVVSRIRSLCDEARAEGQLTSYQKARRDSLPPVEEESLDADDSVFINGDGGGFQ